MTSHVCQYSEDAGVWTVGWFKPDGTWVPLSDHSDDDEAFERVHYLNGGAQILNDRSSVEKQAAALVNVELAKIISTLAGRFGLTIGPGEEFKIESEPEES